MQVLGGDLPKVDGYSVGRDSISWMKSYSLAGASVTPITGADKKDGTRIAHTTTGVGAGFLLAGPLGALVGGAAGFAGAKGTQSGIVFSLTLGDGRQATCHGDVKEYAKILDAIRRAGVEEGHRLDAIRRADVVEGRLPPSLADRDRIRAELAAKKEAAQQDQAAAKLEKATGRVAAREAARLRKLGAKRSIQDGNEVGPE